MPRQLVSAVVNIYGAERDYCPCPAEVKLLLNNSWVQIMIRITSTKSDHLLLVTCSTQTCVGQTYMYVYRYGIM